MVFPNIGNGWGLIQTMCDDLATCTPNHAWLYPPTSFVIDDTQEALFDLVDTLLRHGTSVQVNVGQRVGTSWTGTFGARPSHVEDLVRSLDPTISTNQNGHG